MANKKHTAKVAWHAKGRYCWQLFANMQDAEEWAAKQTFEPSYIGEASWSEHRMFKTDKLFEKQRTKG